MPIRITGMYSGLDTEAIIAELASAQSMKKNSLVKKQISLSWKMDAWKALNTKIYSFYSKTLDNMRFQSSYALKTTKVSSSSVSVTTKNNAVNGVQNLKIKQMAKMGYLTGGEISKENGGKVTASTKLSDLGIEEGGSFSVEVGGKSVKIDVTSGMKVSDVVSKLQNAGLNASFDEKNQRFFVSSKKSGEAYNFHLVGDNETGMDALSKLGLLTETDMKNGYTTWAGYAEEKNQAAYQAVLDKEVAARAASYKKANDNLESKNKELAEANEKLRERISELKGDDYDESITAAKLYDDLYGEAKTETDEDGNEVTVRGGGLKAKLDAAKKASEEDPENSELKDKYDKLQEEFNALNDQYNTAKAIEEAEASITANNTKIDENEAQMEKNQKYFSVDETGKIEGTDDLKTDVKDEFDAKVRNAQAVIADLEKEDGRRFPASKGASKIEGQDAIIYLNDAEFRSESNTFDINGLEITVLEENTEETITLSTGEDIDGIYNMVKNFLTEYNKLINEMDALYNADSSKGYDPLLTEEKDGLSDSEIEEWEKKIKDSILRRDQTLSDVMSTLSNTMLAGTKVNGVQMYLSQFGINTLGYFNAADNEKHAYHIDGDPDDASTMSEDDVLRSMIASDPETVMNFFSQLSKNLYDNLGKQMAGTTASSAFTVYNDKMMKDEYDAYAEKIAKQEEKLNNLMDKWYSKFSKMETAMSKLESKNSALASMLGG